jgi:hypothetical protein
VSRAEDLAGNFLATHREFVEFVKGATPDQWRAKGINHPEIRVGNEDEGRPVGVIVHHVGIAYRNNRIRCQAWIRGEDPELPNAEGNRRHAAENPDPDQGETIRFLEAQAADMHAFISGLSETDLAAKGSFVAGPTTVEESLGRTLPYHIRWHMGSIGATWEDLASRRSAN